MLSSRYSFVLLTIFSVFLTQAINGRPNVKPIDDVKPEETVAEHNKVRAELKLPPMVWNQTLAEIAQNYADKQAKAGVCSPEATKHSGGPYGENIAAGWIADKDQMSGPIAAKFWATEKPNYDYATNKCNGICGHYTQMVSNQSTSLGCGSYRCNNNELIYIICNYSPQPRGDANTRPY